MLSNAYFLAKFRFDTAENEPAKNLQNFAIFATGVLIEMAGGRGGARRGPRRGPGRGPGCRAGRARARARGARAGQG